MQIEGLNGLNPSSLLKLPTEKPETENFSNVFSEFIGSVNSDQLHADAVTKDFIMGKDVELHEVMIAGEKAKTTLELLMEIRNKAVDMYKELVRMSP
ncbi:MAG TPA: flagellar hook-basal body complex protein FliE [Ignavibacteriaceae bacterium]|nr:flagellar hook-basal body complex protein FliE [Ignavibacteriaceae bacterium]